MKNNTRRAFFASLMALLLCVSSLMGTTYAWFTDSVTSGNNIISSGNLDIELYYQVEGESDWTKVTEDTNIFKKNALWEPGYTEIVRLKVVNEGTLALKYQLGVNVAAEVGSINTYGEPFKLSDFIRFGIVDGAADYTRESAIAAVASTATPLNTAYSSAVTTLEAKNGTDSDETVLTMVVYMPSTVGNDANAKKGAPVPTLNLGLNLFASQTTAEPDSFDKDYDKNAFVSVTPENFEDVLANLSEGAQLYFGAGIYKVSSNDKLKISKDNVTLIGSGVGVTVIDAEDKSCSGQAALLIDANNVTIKNLTVKTSSANGSVAAIKATNLQATPRILEGIVIENVAVYGAKGHGINLHGVDGATIKNTEIASFGKCALAFAMVTDVTVSGTKTAKGGWMADIGVMYASGDAYATPSTITVKADNSFANGVVYTERPATAPGGADTVIFEAPEAWSKSVNGDQTLYQAAAASINGVGYITLRDAINAAQPGDTVKLNADVLVTLPNHFNSANTAALSIEKDLVLDGNNKTLTVDASNWALYNSGKTGNVLSIGVGDAALGTVTDTNVEVTVKNLSIVGNAAIMKNGISVYQATAQGATTVATFDNVSVNGCGAASVQVNGASLTVKGAESKIGIGAWAYAIGVDKGGSLTVEDGSIDVIQASAQATVKINGGSIGVLNEANLKATVALVEDTDVTLRLLTDITVSEQIEIRKALTLDGQGHTVSGAGTYSVPTNDTGKKYLIACYAPVTVKNMTLVGSEKAAFGLQFYKTDGGKVSDLTMKNFKLGLCVNAAKVTASGTIAQENIAWGGINVSYGTGVTFANPGFDASAATLVGVAAIYSDAGDVANAEFNNTTITITPPAGWTQASMSGGIVFVPTP